MPSHLTQSSLIVLFSVLAACASDSEPDPAADASGPPDAGLEAQVTVLETFDVSEFNTDLIDDLPTVDLAFYLTEGGPLRWSELRTNITRAQRIFGASGVQVRVRAAMRMEVPSDWQVLDADEVDVPITPELLDTDLYAHLDELGTRLTLRNQAIFEAITSYFPGSDTGVPAANTIHVVALNEAPIAFYEWSGSEWQYATAPTGGLSFPPYAYADRIPEHLRGVITLSFEQSIISPQSRILSHEIGHKIINVSHEGVGVCPAFAVEGADLMLYGNGETIPTGAEGRWQRERLALSPFVYTLDQGIAKFANSYEEDGVYSDTMYGDYVVNPVCPSGTP